MKESFEFWKVTRKNILAVINAYSIEQLNHIPDHFNNNLAWQFGHIIVTQQLLCYSLSGLEPLIDKTFILKYRKGTKPTEKIDVAEIEELKAFDEMISNQMISDFSTGKFKEFRDYGTSYGVELHDINEAILFNNLHEAMHLGYMMSIRKMV